MGIDFQSISVTPLDWAPEVSSNAAHTFEWTSYSLIAQHIMEQHYVNLNDNILI